MTHAHVKTVLLVDDNPGLRLLLTSELEAGGYRVIACASAEAALARPPETIDLAVVDYHLPGRSGLKLLQRLRNHCGEVPALVITSEHNVRRDPDWPDNQRTTLLTKPFRQQAFLHSVSGCLKSASTPPQIGLKSPGAA